MQINQEEYKKNQKKKIAEILREKRKYERTKVREKEEHEMRVGHRHVIFGDAADVIC